MELFICIGKRLREVREGMGLSQSEFAGIAERAGVPGATRQSQARYEKGEQMPGAAYLAAIAGAGADVFYILTGQTIVSKQQPEPPTHEEIEILVNYRLSREEDRQALARTAAAMAQQAKPKAHPRQPKGAVMLDTEHKGRSAGPKIISTEHTGKRTGPTIVGEKATPKKKHKDEAS